MISKLKEPTTSGQKNEVPRSKTAKSRQIKWPLWRGGPEPHADEADEAEALAETCVRKHDEIDVIPERDALLCSCSHMY